MKKVFFTGLIASVLLLTACNDEEMQKKIQQLETQITDLKQAQRIEIEKLQETQNAKIALLQKEEMIRVKEKAVLFQKKDEKYPVEFSLTTLKTNKEWLNKLLVQQLLEKRVSAESVSKVTDPQAELIKVISTQYQSELDEAKEHFADQPDEKISATYFSAEDQTSVDYIGQKENLATFTLSNYNYIGGAHGMYHTNYLNIDLEKQKIISLDDIFSKENQAKLKEMLWNRYETEYREADGNMGFFFKNKEKLHLPQDFYFSAAGINFVYPVYEIGAYADGQKELMLYWQEIEAFINPEYRY